MPSIEADLYHIRLDGRPVCTHPDTAEISKLIVCVYRWRISAEQARERLLRRFPARNFVVVPGNCPGH